MKTKTLLTIFFALIISYSFSQQITPSQNEEGKWGFSENLAAVQLKKKYGYINKLGETVIPFGYSNANSFSEGLTGVRKGKKCDYIDKSGKLHIPLQFDKVYNFYKGKVKVQKDGKEFYINSKGKCIEDCP